MKKIPAQSLKYRAYLDLLAKQVHEEFDAQMEELAAGPRLGVNVGPSNKIKGD